MQDTRVQKTERARTLLDFDRPPVVETALGFLFAPIEGWDILHYGQLWDRFRSEYPLHEIKQAIGQVEIQFGSDPQADFGNLPIRCWFVNAASTQLVQVQNTCFIRNWRWREDSPGYLHYESTKENFKKDWGVFCQFLADNKLPSPAVWQGEVSYINQLIRGREWNSFEDLFEVFPMWHPNKNGSLDLNMQVFSFVVAYALPNIDGHLQFMGQPGVRRSDGKEIFQLTVTASGKASEKSHDALFSLLDVGHAAVVNGFKDFTSEKMHKFWGIR